MAKWIPSSNMSCIISISLYPGCYRHIRISFDSTLEELHKAILDAFGFDDDHAHAFFMDNKAWSHVDSYYWAEVADDERATCDYRLSQLELPVGKKFKYVFDFGEAWTFSLKILRIIEEPMPEPLVVRSVGDSPEQYPRADWDDNDAEEDDEDDEDGVPLEFPEVYSKRKAKQLYRDLPLSQNVITLLTRYFDAFANLYMIIPLRKALEIYNSQNPPLDEGVFLQFADILRHEDQHFYIMGEDEVYADVHELAKPIDRLIIHESLLIIGPDDFAETQRLQGDKPYYVPDKQALLKYADDLYFEKGSEFTALMDFFRKVKRFSPDEVLDIADELQLNACMSSGDDLDGLFHTLEWMGVRFRDIEEINAFYQLYARLSNATRKPINRGFTPNELMARPEFQPKDVKLKPGIKAAISSGYLSIDELRDTALAGNELLGGALQESFLGELDRIEQELQDEAAGKRAPDTPVPASRNAPCPCGSGRKYKHCCGKNRGKPN